MSYPELGGHSFSSYREAYGRGILIVRPSSGYLRLATGDHAKGSVSARPELLNQSPEQAVRMAGASPPMSSCCK